MKTNEQRKIHLAGVAEKRGKPAAAQLRADVWAEMNRGTE